MTPLEQLNAELAEFGWGEIVLTEGDLNWCVEHLEDAKDRRVVEVHLGLTPEGPCGFRQVGVVVGIQPHRARQRYSRVLKAIRTWWKTDRRIWTG